MKIIAEVENVRYPQDNNNEKAGGWFILAATVNGKSVTCKGNIAWRPEYKETLELTGDFANYKGEKQFSFHTARITVPCSSYDQLRYVCDRAHGIGTKMMQKIWETLGESWKELKDGDIPRLRTEAIRSFQEQVELLSSNKEKVEAIAWLEAKGCTTNLANKAYETWQNNTIGVVQANCYRLADLPNYGFKDVDAKVRPAFGIADDDDRRITAAVKYTLQKLSDSGDTAVSIHLFQSSICELLKNINRQLVADTVQQMLNEYELIVFAKEQMICTKKAYDTELTIFNYINTQNENEPKTYDLSEFIANADFVPDEIQQQAIQFALNNKLSVINGGAGTGKTTIIKIIAEALKKYTKHDLKLCAFAGKASARLKEATDLTTSTIHSMLGFNGVGFQVASLRDCVVVIDEASMVDAQLMSEIISRQPEKIILVGDQAQLPPVGAGQPFHDLLQIKPELIRTLKNCYRNTEAVFKAATAIRQGEMPLPEDESESEKWTMTHVTEASAIQNYICNIVKQRHINFDTDIILCGRNGELDKETDLYAPGTVRGLNQAIKAIINPSPEKLAEGDRVINTKNNSEKNIWNGTTGEISKIDMSGNVYFELDLPFKQGEEIVSNVRLTKGEAKNLELAYAMTVHKSQGSQYSTVIMVGSGRDKWVLTRPLVYTGVTRTKKECYFIGDSEVFKNSLARKSHKNTVLQMLELTK